MDAVPLLDGILVVVEESRDRLIAMGALRQRIALVSNTPPLARLNWRSATQGGGGPVVAGHHDGRVGIGQGPFHAAHPPAAAHREAGGHGTGTEQRAARRRHRPHRSTDRGERPGKEGVELEPAGGDEQYVERSAAGHSGKRRQSAGLPGTPGPGV